MSTVIKPAFWKTPQGYAASHCLNCTAGWTRKGKDGVAHTICLLDREPVLVDMTDCDRYEEREAKPQPLPQEAQQA